MHNGMKLEEMLAEVVRHSETKIDFLADTSEHIAMVPMPDFDDGVALVLQKEASSVLERFSITDNCHKQIASRLKIPMTYYKRLLQDHKEMVIENVNGLFRREPALRMVRTLDGKARAFLSRQYRRVDNEQILEATLPVINQDFDTTILNTWVDENRLRFKCLFNGPEHEVNVGPTARRPQGEILHAGFEMGNSEVGKSTFYIRGFLYNGFCLNGQVYGTTETMALKQVHIGSKLGLTDDLVLSEDTQRKEDDLIISAARDVLVHLSSPDFTKKVGERVAMLRGTKAVKDPHAAVEAITKELRLSDVESKGVLESFIRDQDYTQWGMVNAVTEQANPVNRLGATRDVSYPRASKIEEMGNKIINLPANRWNRIAETVAIAA